MSLKTSFDKSVSAGFLKNVLPFPQTPLSPFPWYSSAETHEDTSTDHTLGYSFRLAKAQGVKECSLFLS